MINTQIIDTKTFTALDALTNWEKNPRSIKKDAFERLKTHIRDHGQMQPLVVTPEGVVLGGNMRLRAYHELSIDPVWVEVVEPKDEAEKLRIALVLNDRAGFYDDDLLANLIPEYPDFAWDEYAVDLKEPTLISSLLEKSNGDTGIEFKREYQVVIDCQDEDRQREMYETLTQQGITCRVLTL